MFLSFFQTQLEPALSFFSHYKMEDSIENINETFDFEGMKRPQLLKLCKKHGIKASGTVCNI